MPTEPDDRPTSGSRGTSVTLDTITPNAGSVYLAGTYAPNGGGGGVYIHMMNLTDNQVYSPAFSPSSTTYPNWSRTVTGLTAGKHYSVTVTILYNGVSDAVANRFTAT